MRKRWLPLLGDGLPMLGMVGAVAVVNLFVWRVSCAVDATHVVHVKQESVVAGLVASEAAELAVTKYGAGTPSARAVSVASPAGLHCRIAPVVVGERRALDLWVTGARGRSYWFRCAALAGAAPAHLAHPLSLRQQVVAKRPELRAHLQRTTSKPFHPLARDLDLSTWVDRSTRWGSAADVAVDDSAIGLLRLPAGTDRRDFRLDEVRLRHRVPASGVAAIPGNLWVDAGPRPLVLELDSALTLVVAGNIYLGRSVVVRGGGSLLLVALRGGVAPFRDADGDGRWSDGDHADGVTYTGPLEGAGMVYLGLPGRRQPIAPRVHLVGSVIAEGEVYVRTRAAQIHGALVAGQGITWFGDAELHLPGDLLPNIERDAIPGLQRAGPVRPGRLRRSRLVPADRPGR